MQKFLTLFGFIILISICLSSIRANQGDIGRRVTKTACTSLAEYGDMSLNKVRDLLLINAKREALSQIYGEMIYSESIVENWKLISDKIISKSLGIIRIEGDPEYYNGKNFGEVCVKINAYVTNQDLEKFKVIIVNLDRYCYTNPNMPLKNIKEKARESALLEIVKRQNPALKNISVDHASKLVHNFNIVNENFDFNTSSFCMDVKAEIIPFEIEFYNPDYTNGITPEPSSSESGDFFYEDFSTVTEGSIPSGWMGGEHLVVGSLGRAKALYPSPTGRYSDVIITKPIEFPENFRLEFVISIPNSCWGMMQIFVGSASFGNRCCRILFNQDEIHQCEIGTNASLVLEKRGNVFSVSLNGKQYHLKRLTQYEKPRNIRIQFSGEGRKSVIIHRIHGKELTN
ncbi:MAG: hypothetical protein L6Q29_03275 [Candidatus Pacebacteria bacterium]|nr:hypothetical protein [Candidatus Paceibacterota bacterium]